MHLAAKIAAAVSIWVAFVNMAGCTDDEPSFEGGASPPNLPESVHRPDVVAAMRSRLGLAGVEFAELPRLTMVPVPNSDESAMELMQSAIAPTAGLSLPVLSDRLLDPRLAARDEFHWREASLDVSKSCLQWLDTIYRVTADSSTLSFSVRREEYSFERERLELHVWISAPYLNSNSRDKRSSQSVGRLDLAIDGDRITAAALAEAIDNGQCSIVAYCSPTIVIEDVSLSGIVHESRGPRIGDDAIVQSYTLVLRRSADIDFVPEVESFSKYQGLDRFVRPADLVLGDRSLKLYRKPEITPVMRSMPDFRAAALHGFPIATHDESRLRRLRNTVQGPVYASYVPAISVVLEVVAVEFLVGNDTGSSVDLLFLNDARASTCHYEYYELSHADITWDITWERGLGGAIVKSVDPSYQDVGDYAITTPVRIWCRERN